LRTDIKNELFWDDAKSKADQWIEAYPNSPTAKLVKALVLEQYAWMHRGHGYASSVSKEGWEKFYSNIQAADKHLLESYEQASSDPEWYHRRCNTLNALSIAPENFLEVVNEGLERFPGYYQIYFCAMDYFAPRWHGDKETIEEFAKSSIEHSREQEGLGMYARIYWYASQTQYDWSLFTDSAVDWGMMSAGIDDVIQRYPDQWNIQNFAVFSCLAGDVEKTRNLISKFEGGPIRRVWRNPQMFEYCTNL
jgi:hypothetical protein